MSFNPLCKIQKKEMARILRGQLPPEVTARLAAQAKAEAANLIRAAADKAIATVESEKARAVLEAGLAAEYERTRAERIKAEQAKRFLDNAQRLS